MRYGIAAAIFALAMTGSGVMADGEGVGLPLGPPEGTPPVGNADIYVVSGGHASAQAQMILDTVEVSPVFDAASTTAPPPSSSP